MRGEGEGWWDTAEDAVVLFERERVEGRGRKRISHKLREALHLIDDFCFASFWLLLPYL
jgi:hypothetical protein